MDSPFAFIKKGTGAVMKKQVLVGEEFFDKIIVGLGTKKCTTLGV